MVSLFYLLVSLTPQQSDAADLMKGIWSPYCKGISLLECPSSKAEELREEIYDRMQRGESRDQVWANLQSRYGDQLQMNPSTSGREGWAHRLPWILTLLGIILVGTFWLTRPRRAATAPQSSIDAKIEERILKDLEDRQG